jgi:hypothetical protein
LEIENWKVKELPRPYYPKLPTASCHWCEVAGWIAIAIAIGRGVAGRDCLLLTADWWGVG